jgi:PqqA peptide cyclase
MQESPTPLPPSVTDHCIPTLVRGVRLHLDWARGRHVLLAPERVIGLDLMAFEVLSRCDGSRSVSAIADELAARYSGDPTAILSDVRGVLQKLSDIRYIVAGGRSDHLALSATRHSSPAVSTGLSEGLPIAVLAELTHRCPLQCPYCSNPVDLERNELATGEWARVIGEVADMGVLQIHFSGGEPLVRKDLVALIAHAAARHLYTNLITSGVLLDRERLELLAMAGLDHVQISFQGVRPERADRFANYEGAHRKKVAAARLVRELDLPLTLNAVVHRQNLGELPDIIAMAVELDAARLEVAHVQYQGWALKNRASLIPTETQFNEAAEVVERAKERLRGILVVDHVIPDYYAVRPKNCMGGWGSQFLNITPSGTVLPCHAAQTIPGLAFETVRDHSLDWIWRQSSAMRKFRGLGWMTELCKSCAFREIDHGGCRCQAFALTGDAVNADPTCDKSSFHESVVALARREANAGNDQFSYRKFPRQNPFK